MGLVKNGFIDLGNNLFIKETLIKEYKKNGVILLNGDSYLYGEFMATPFYRDDLYGSNKGEK